VRIHVEIETTTFQDKPRQKFPILPITKTSWDRKYVYTGVVIIVCAYVLKVPTPKHTCNMSCDSGDQRTRGLTDNVYYS
jgi:hypothetical protein